MTPGGANRYSGGQTATSVGQFKVPTSTNLTTAKIKAQEVLAQAFNTQGTVFKSVAKKNSNVIFGV